MRRFVGAVLVGLGALLLVLAIGLPTFLAPAVGQIPSTLQPCKAGSRTDPAGCLAPTDAKATNATYLQFDPAGAHINTGDLITTFEIVPQTDKTSNAIADGKLDGDAEIWDVFQTTKDSVGVKVAQQSAELALNRKTGAAVPWEGQFLNDGTEADVKFSGNEYQFPFNTQKQDYAVFDDNVKTTTTAHFRSTDNIDGLDTYHFAAQIPSTELSLPRESIEALMQLFAPNATSAKLMYTDDKEIWVDPSTGVLIKVRDHQTKTFVADDGTTKTLLDGDFQSLDSETAQVVASAKKNGQQLLLVGVYAPIGFGLVGLILLIVGFVLLRAGDGVGPGPDSSWDENLPQSRHRLRADQL
jgi:hypothetical protein